LGLCDAHAFVRPAAELGLPVEIMDHLPCIAEGKLVRILLTPEQWGAALQKCAGHEEVTQECHAIAKAAMRVALRNAGIDPASVGDARLAEKFQIVEQGPDFVRDADFLTLDEQFYLAQVDDQSDNPLVQEARQMTCALIRDRRENPGTEDAAATCKADLLGVKEIYASCVHELVRAQRLAQDDELLADGESLTETLVGALGKSGAIQDREIDGRPALDVFAERLAAIPSPELHLLGMCLLRRDIAVAADRWLTAVLQEEELSCSS
jgi:hypothetical protein